MTLEAASQQIEQFLVNKRNKESAAAELARLRANAKIEYLNKSMALDAKPAPAAAPAQAAPGARAAAPAAPTDAGGQGGARARRGRPEMNQYPLTSSIPRGAIMNRFVQWIAALTADVVGLGSPARPKCRWARATWCACRSTAIPT